MSILVSVIMKQTNIITKQTLLSLLIFTTMASFILSFNVNLGKGISILTVIEWQENPCLFYIKSKVSTQ